jgi:hypothetical protein
MGLSLEEAKARVREALLGKAGVHAVGVRPSEGSVIIYMRPGCEKAPVESLASRHAAPYRVRIVEAEEPVASFGGLRSR